MTEQPATAAESIYAAVAVLAGICFFAAIDFILPAFLVVGNDGEMVGIGFAFGFLFSQITLISIWFGLSAGHRLIRFPWTCLAFAFLWLVVAYGFLYESQQPGANDRVATSHRFQTSLAIFIAGIAAFSLLVFSYARSRVGFRLAWSTNGASNRFQLRDLFLFIVGLCVLLAGSKRVLPLSEIKAADFSWLQTLSIAVPTYVATVISCNAVLAVALMQIMADGNSSRLFGRLGATLIGVTLLEVLISAGLYLPIQISVVVVMMNITQMAVIVTWFAVFLRLGVRMHSPPSGAQ